MFGYTQKGLEVETLDILFGERVLMKKMNTHFYTSSQLTLSTTLVIYRFIGRGRFVVSLILSL